MKLNQILLRFLKEYKPNNPNYQVKLDKSHINRLQNIRLHYTNGFFMFFLSDIVSCISLKATQYNVYDYVYESRKIKQTFDWILKLYLKEDLVKLLSKYHQLDGFFQEYYDYNSNMSFCDFMFNAHLRIALKNNDFLINSIKEKYKNIILNKLFN